MENRYKVILTGKQLYREIELGPDISSLRVGPGAECDVRLRRELFFEPIELTFQRDKGRWSVVCSDNIYLTVDEVRKLMVTPLHHGDDFKVKYQESGNTLMQLAFMMDFDYETKPYDVRIDLTGAQRVQVGGNGDIVLTTPSVGTDQFLLSRQADGGWALEAEKTQYGTYLNGRRVTGKHPLAENDFISLAEFSFCYKADGLYTSQREGLSIPKLPYYTVLPSKSEHVYPKFNRSTRIQWTLPDEKIEILDPPQPPQKPKGNLITKLLPALAMLAVTVILRGLMSNSGGAYVLLSVCTMGIGIITTAAGFIGDKKTYREDTAHREETYHRYMEEKEKAIQGYRDEEAELLEKQYPDVMQECAWIEDFSASLFDRNPTDKDFLELRLGTGENKAKRAISYKQQEKLECTDPLAQLPQKLAEQFDRIENTPIILPLLEENAVGVVGKRAEMFALLKNMTLDLAVRHYYGELSLFYVISEDCQDQFQWLRLLPHVQNPMLAMRNIVCDTESKGILFEYLYKKLSRLTEEKEAPREQSVIFVFHDMGLKKHPISQFLDRAAKCGMHFIFFEEQSGFLPTGCGSVITLDRPGHGTVVSAKDGNTQREFSFGAIPDETAQKLCDKLAPVYCEEVSLEGALTKNITLYELLNIVSASDLDLANRWSSSTVYKTMAAPLGVKAKNQVVFLDLHEKAHGPHGLVAGTTGSGKSELLQTYILTMATLYHPYEVGFVIIDFKGGGMVNQFRALPHLIGSITNIDGKEIQRSLLSIRAELRKRQELFAEYGVNHIDAYIKLFKKGATPTPLPHLILIVDEFAELKMDQPEFMKELISAARIGRSLGIHLILATQKPSGVVDAQIWSNSRFKLCLKVQNQEDSNEVLKTPLAAEIREPGRAYLQVGNNEIFDLFQSAYSGAPSIMDDAGSQRSFAINRVELSGRRTMVYRTQHEQDREERETQLEAVVKRIADHCKREGIEQLPGICLPPLPELLNYPSEAAEEPDPIRTTVPLGVFDDPNSQYQGKVVLDLTEGNTIILGSSQYGKTNLLQSILRGISAQYTPKEVNAYILDFGSMALKAFRELNHVGGVVVAAEDEKLKNFMAMMEGEIARRKEAFSQMGITSFTSYKEAGNRDMPHIIIMIDNFLALKELYPDHEEALLHLCREGVALGISLVVTALQSNGISYKYMSNFSNRICLYCNQAEEYGTLFDHCRMEPKNVPGRGLVVLRKVVYEFQSYLAFEGEKEIQRVAAIKAYLDQVNRRDPDQRARRIPEVPGQLTPEYVRENYRPSSAKKSVIPVGIDYDSVQFVTLDLEKAMTVGVTGREGFGKTNFLRWVMNSLQRQIFDYPSQVYLFDDYAKQLKDMGGMGIVERYTIDLNELEEVMAQVETTMQERLTLVQEDGLEALEQEPLILLVIQNTGVFAADGLSKDAVESYKRIVKNGKNLKICFLFAQVENASAGYGASEMAKQMKELNTLLVMDDISNLKIMDIGPAVLRQFKKPLNLGDGYIVTDQAVQKLKIVHCEEG